MSPTAGFSPPPPPPGFFSSPSPRKCPDQYSTHEWQLAQEQLQDRVLICPPRATTHQVASGNRPAHCRIRTASARRSRVHVIRAKRRKRAALVPCPAPDVRGCLYYVNTTRPTHGASRQTLCRRKIGLHVARPAGCPTARGLAAVQGPRRTEILAIMRSPVAARCLCVIRQSQDLPISKAIILALHLVCRLSIGSGVG